MSKAHPGFKAVQAKVEREGYSAKTAAKIVAAGARHASAAAKKRNPRLNRVAGVGNSDHVGRKMAKKSSRMGG